MTPRVPASGRTLLALLTAVTLVSPASALTRNPTNNVALLPGPAPEATALQGKVAVGVESGVPRALYNVDYAVQPSDPEAMARQYLRENAAQLRLMNANLSDLALRATRPTPAGVVVRFEQRVQGIPVLAPDLAVTINNQSKVTFVMSGYQPGVAVASITPQVLAAAARAAAVEWLHVQGKLAFDTNRLVVVPDGKAGRLAWEIRLIPSLPPHGDWQILVDANTGEVFRVENLEFDLNGTGFVYDPDPLGTAHAFYGAPYNDAGDVTNAQLDAARSSRTLQDITDIGGGTIKLQGPWAQIVDFESPFKGLFTQVGTTFNFDRANDAFEAVNCYFHIDQQMRHVNFTLGIPVTPYQYVGGVKFDPSGFSGADNSHYLSGSGQLSFGEGGVDDAEDADVVLHELGHGLHDWLTAGGLSQVNGLSEGLGDYVCQSYSRSLGQWTSPEAPFEWTFSWDGHNEFWPGRVTNYGAMYPGGLDGEVHDDGQIWATCLMRIWNQIGRIKTDKAVYVGIASTNGSASQNDAAQAVLEAAGSLGYSSADIGVMVTEFQATGYTVSIGVDYQSNAVTDVCASPPSNENGVLEPGEEATIRVTVQAASLAQTGVSGTLTSSTPGVTILDGTATWPNLSPGVPTVCDAPYFRVKLDSSVPCLSAVNFQLSVTSNEGGPYPMSFTKQVGSSLTPSGLPLAIPDNVPAGVTSTLSVGQNLNITDVNVRVQITHSYVGDLFIKLRSPLGTEVTLLDRPGFPTSTFGCGDNNMDVTFDDGAATVLETWCTGSTPWYTGPARAVGLLSAFNGQSTQGNWVLTVSDNAGVDVGSVTNWELITTPVISGICNTCLVAVGVEPAIGAGRLGLGQNYPNPATSSTSIQFEIARPGRASLRIYDVSGHLITTLLDGEFAAGARQVSWDGTDQAGKRVASGIYFYRLVSAGTTAQRHMLLVH